MNQFTTLERIAPQAVGIPSGDVHALVDALQASGTEMHGLVILRHGKVAAEGWWSPYGPGQVHGSQSLTKTMTGSAFGIAMQEGLLSLDTRVINVFPEYAPLCEGKPYWDELCLRHMTTMGSGMETQPAIDRADWIEKFFTMDIVHKPGTAFYYNSTACSMVGACIRKLTGLGLREYLRPRLLDIIGIDADRLKWHCHPDGMENGSGGLISTTEDNARLMDLYRQGGAWNGQQLLSPDWVSFAMQTQNDHMAEASVSYGGMMWKRGDCLMADGAMGQWSMFFPEKDLVVSLNQTISTAEQSSAVMDAVFSFAHALPDGDVPLDEQSAEALQQRLAALAMPAPAYHENKELLQALDNTRYQVMEGSPHFFADDLIIFNPSYAMPVTAFGFKAVDGNLELAVETAHSVVQCPVGLKGQRLVHTVPNNNPACTLAISGAMPDGHTLELEIRWLESCRVHRLVFQFAGEEATAVSSRDKVGGFDIDNSTIRLMKKGGSHA